MATKTQAKGLQRPLRVGSLELPHRVLLAPLAGVTDIPFRRICQEHGAGLTSVEMLSAVAIRYRAERTEAMMARHESEQVLGVQLTGAEPADVAGGARWLKDHGFDLIDLNMGCPVRKIVGKGWGAALLKEPDRIGDIVAATRSVIEGPLSAKIRTGYLRDRINVTETAKRIAAGGADLITIHGRTRADSYADPVDYDNIRRGLAAARAVAGDNIVTVGNGNIMDAGSARIMEERTGCDAVMVSRGALGNPWIFRALLNPDFNEPTVAEWREVLVRHIDYHEEHYGTAHRAAVLIRKHLLWYLTGFPGVKRMRAECSVVESLNEARDRVSRFADGLPQGLRRYDATPGSSGREREMSYDPKEAMDRRTDRGVAGEDPAV